MNSSAVSCSLLLSEFFILSNEYEYIGVEKHGFIKPQITTPQEILDSRAKIHNGVPGNAIIFHDRLIHGGKIGGELTRVSLEFTILVEK